MEKRRFGCTGHMSTVAIFGSYAFAKADQKTADELMERLLEHGVNHIDVAPTYGDAEIRLAPWMPSYRDRFFVGCKTTERGKSGARREMEESLERLGIDHFDLYQLHAVNDMHELDQATRTGGALEEIIRARDEGLTRFIGITGHGIAICEVLMEALDRYDFDSVLFPVNFIQYGIEQYRKDAEELIRRCGDEDVGIMAIKSIAKGRLEGRTIDYDTWYDPLTDKKSIQQAVNFTLSQDVTGLCTAGDAKLLPLVLDACEYYTKLLEEEQEELIQKSSQYQPLFPPK